MKPGVWRADSFRGVTRDPTLNPKNEIPLEFCHYCIFVFSPLAKLTYCFAHSADVVIDNSRWRDRIRNQTLWSISKVTSGNKFVCWHTCDKVLYIVTHHYLENNTFVAFMV